MISLVGIGSTLFHGTLRHKMQLLGKDEEKNNKECVHSYVGSDKDKRIVSSKCGPQTIASKSKVHRNARMERTSEKETIPSTHKYKNVSS